MADDVKDLRRRRPTPYVMMELGNTEEENRTRTTSKKKKEGRGIIFELKKKSKLSRSRKEEKITTVNGRCQGTQMTRQGTRQIERRVKAVQVGQTAGGEDVGGGRTMGMAVAAAGPRGHIMFSWSVVLSGHPSLPLFPLIFPPLASMVPVKIPPPSSI